MSEESFAELNKLKQRLESLGVKIRGAPAETPARISKDKVCPKQV
jgi:hypothetical protein